MFIYQAWLKTHSFPPRNQFFSFFLMFVVKRRYFAVWNTRTFASSVWRRALHIFFVHIHFRPRSFHTFILWKVWFDEAKVKKKKRKKFYIANRRLTGKRKWLSFSLMLIPSRLISIFSCWITLFSNFQFLLIFSNIQRPFLCREIDLWRYFLI